MVGRAEVLTGKMVNVRRIVKGVGLAVCLPGAVFAAPLPVTVAVPADSAAVTAFEAGTPYGIRFSDPLSLIDAPPRGAVYVEDAGAVDVAALAGAMPPGSLLIVNDCDADYGGWPALRADLALAPAGCDTDATRDAVIAALALDADQVAAHLAEVGFVIHRAGSASRSVETGLVVTALPAETVLRLTGAEIIHAAAPANTPLPVPAVSGPAPRRAGLPEPSIITGDLARLIAPGRRGPLGLAFADREALRAMDPDRFAQMLDSGGFDPEPEQIAVALQTELQRMNCYAGTIDGDWGAGSAGALRRYFQTVGAAQAATTADISAFRAIARQAPAECPALVVAPTPRSQPAAAASTPRAATQRGASRQTQTPARAAAPAPASNGAASSGGPRIGNRLGGAGMFR
ncbi:MAG: hypothetical protein Q4G49_05485 [Paracoccus sp. (in: a-proteobacteria)]|nr:hypothetical protein [Paracoccus sp. (in: a-proteobacteria)]